MNSNLLVTTIKDSYEYTDVSILYWYLGIIIILLILLLWKKR